MEKYSNDLIRHSVSFIGDVSFDYQDYKGKYSIGEAEFSFETRWFIRDNRSIWALSTADNINGVAIDPEITLFRQLRDASKLQFSRARMALVGELVVFRNIYGRYAALRIDVVTVRSRAMPAELRFRYVINWENSADFSAYSAFDWS